MLSRDISACRHLRITSRKKTARDGCYKTATPTTINVSTWYVEIAPDWKQFSTPKEIDRGARERDPRCDLYSFCMRLRLTRTSTQNDHSIAACRGMAREHNLRSTHTATLLPRRPRPPIHGRAFCAPGISSLYSMAFAGRAVMACAALGGARWRPLAAGLRQSGGPPPHRARAELVHLDRTIDHPHEPPG